MEPERQTNTPAQPQVAHVGKEKSGMGRKLLMLLVALVLLGIGAAGGWYYRDKQAQDDLNVKQAELSSLQTKNAQLNKDLADAKKTTTAAPTSKQPSAATLDNIKASITSGNTAALEGYMATSVRVIIAASEGMGDRTPAQAVSDVTSYIKNATSPWDFALSTTTLSNYQSGDYKQYFPSTALVGQSANKYVISFQFDANGKINGVFMTNSADLL